MPDITTIAITASFFLAFAVFLITALSRAAGAGSRAADPAIAPASEPVSIYQPPGTEPPPPLPPALAGKIATWPYRRIDLLGIGIIFLLFAALVTASGIAMAEEEVTISAEALVMSAGIQFFFAGIAIAFMAARLPLSAWLGLRWKEWPWVFLIAPGTVVGMWLIFGGLQAAGYMKWMESLGVESVQDTVKLLQTTTDPVILGLMAFTAVIVAPLCEEIVFRGYLYPVAKRFCGPWVAAFCTALFFSAAHGALTALLPLFLFGLVLVFLYEKTGSIWAPIAVHFCFNAATVVVQIIARIYDIPLETGS